MIKIVFAAVVQSVMFFVIFAAFSFFPPFHLEHVLGPTPEGTRVFIWDGLLISALFFVAFLAIEAMRKRIARDGVWTTAAFVLAVIVGFAIKLGFKTN